MKTMPVDRYTVDTIKALGTLINDAKHMQRAYFWRPPTSADSRRRYEQQHSHPTICWTENGCEFEASYDVTCSCNNIYAKGTYRRNGKTTTLLAIQNSYERMRAAMDAPNAK